MNFLRQTGPAAIDTLKVLARLVSLAAPLQGIRLRRHPFVRLKRFRAASIQKTL
jgi:hypothetical protein